MRIAMRALALVACGWLIQVGALVGALASEDYRHYCNSKYGYCVDYPTFLNPQGEPDAADGQNFSSEKSSLKMAVWGTFNNWMNGEPMSLSQQRDWDLKNLDSQELPQPKVTYKSAGKTWFVVSGTSGESIFYRRTVRTPDSFATVQLVYPLAQKEKFKDMVSHIAQSLR